jgi:hypothetical protein
MQMVWKYHRCRNLECVPHLRVPESASQQIDVFREQAQPAIGKVHSEEIAAARDEIASVIRHCADRSRPDGFRFAIDAAKP